jgi:excinuclease ABC subunit C
LVKLAEKNIESAIDEVGPLADLQTTLNLAALPSVIECFDISNLGREHVVAGMVRFVDGKPNRSNYRRFRIKTVSGQDDFASVNEAVMRRYRRLLEEKASMPDLIVVDGGFGQVSAARMALQMLGLQLPLIGLAKEHEEIYLPDDSMPQKFDSSSRMMLLLRQIRDAAHNYALSYNKKRREMKIEKEFQTKQNIET